MLTVAKGFVIKSHKFKLQRPTATLDFEILRIYKTQNISFWLSVVVMKVSQRVFNNTKKGNLGNIYLTRKRQWLGKQI